MNQNSKNNNNKKNISEIMINILCEYLKGLNNNFITYISNKIMNNFIQYKQKMITKKLNTMFIIYTKQELLLMQKNLLKWRKYIYKDSSADLENNNKDNYFNLNLNVGGIINNSSRMPILNDGQIITNNNNSNITNSHLNNSNMNNFYNENENNQNNYLINDYKNKKKEYRNNYSTINNSISNYSTIQKGKQRSYSSEDIKKNKICNPIMPSREKGLIYQIKKNKPGSEMVVNKFIKRQEKYIKSNCQKKQRILQENEEENKLIYTFEPKVNDSLRKLYKKDKLSASTRLYNDSISRQNKILENQININNNSKMIPGKSFNQNKYLELYEESKTKKERHEELIKKIERECGYTYQPNIMHKKNKNDTNNEIKNINNKKDKKSLKINENNKSKNDKKIEKNNSCKSIITQLKKKDKKINGNNNENKENGLMKKNI